MNKRLGKIRLFGHYYEREQLTLAVIFLIPVLAAVFFLFILPVVQVIHYSFTDMNTTKGFTKYVGFDNFKYLFDDSKFGKALRNTVVYAGLKLVFDTGLALFIALLLDQNVPLRKFIRCSYFAPVVVPVVASSLIWLWFYDPTVGPFNAALQAIGLKPLKWLNSSDTALISVLIFSIWKGVGYNVILFLTGLQNIPDSYIEAAKVDGASNWKTLWKIKIPLLRPITSFIIMIGIINTFKVFAEVDILTPKGGPQYSSALIVNYIYEQAFTRGKMGRGCAAAIILFLIIFAITMIQSRMDAHKTVDYD